jgi:pSer/pThr/pTyr-binding forkhead associated (FHA) protein
MIYKSKAPQPTEAASPVELGVEREEFTLTMNGRTRVLTEPRLVMGRSKECDLQVPDANVSRRHAELRHEGSSWWVVDLDSTNGTDVNGKRVPRAKLASGDTITLGETELVFARRGGAA